MKFIRNAFPTSVDVIGMTGESLGVISLAYPLNTGMTTGDGDLIMMGTVAGNLNSSA
jgi:hypothetical protein